MSPLLLCFVAEFSGLLIGWAIGRSVERAAWRKRVLDGPLKLDLRPPAFIRDTARTPRETVPDRKPINPDDPLSDVALDSILVNQSGVIVGIRLRAVSKGGTVQTHEMAV